MDIYYNYKNYYSFIKRKYENSTLDYGKKLDKSQNPEIFLHLYESMNVYPIYPRPIIMGLKNPITNMMMLN